MTENTPPKPTDAERIAALEAELFRVKRERDMYKATIYDAFRGSEFDRPLTEAEIEDMLHGPRGEGLEELLSELEAKHGIER